MKTFFVSILLVAFIVSCKKNDISSTCEKTLTSISGRYKLAKLESVSYNTGEVLEGKDAMDPAATADACPLRHKKA